MTSSHPRRRTALALAAVALLVPACDAVSEAVDDARQTVEDTTELVQFCTSALRVAQAVQDEDVDKAVSAGESMVANAPDEIAAEAETVLSGARQAQGGDPSALQSEGFQAAARAVTDFTADRCDPR